jgi:hypothetical protein
MTDGIICPHCGEFHSQYDNLLREQIANSCMSTPIDFECDCGASFLVALDWSVYAWVMEHSLKLPTTDQTET